MGKTMEKLQTEAVKSILVYLLWARHPMGQAHLACSSTSDVGSSAATYRACYDIHRQRHISTSLSLLAIVQRLPRAKGPLCGWECVSTPEHVETAIVDTISPLSAFRRYCMHAQ